MSRPSWLALKATRRSGRLAIGAVALVGVAMSCKENLPSGPESFAVTLATATFPDTIVVGEAKTAQARVTDAAGRVIQSLQFHWSAADPLIVSLSDPAGSQGRSQQALGLRTGRTLVTMSLVDTRFVVPNFTRNVTVVVGGVAIATSHDTTLRAINDTAIARASGLTRVGAALVPTAGQGIRWTHKGTNTTAIINGDTVRSIAKTNGVDTLIATHDFCLSGARCADTAIVRVTQALKLVLSSKDFRAWSLGDTVGPTVSLVDSRGSGQAGAVVRFVPVTAADSAVVTITPAVGTSVPATGVMAVPGIVASGQGSARIRVLGVAANGVSVLDTDSVTAVVRQVARTVAVEALRVTYTANDSVPMKPVARDARGNPIADATFTIDVSGVALNGIWAGPTPFVGTALTGSIAATLTGAALPGSNPLAPQLPVTSLPAIVTVFQRDTATAGATQRTFTATLLSPTGLPLAGRLVRFRVKPGTFADSATSDAAGLVTIPWTPRDSAASYTFTAVMSATAVPVSVADSAGLIVLRRTVLVVPDVVSDTASTLAATATTLAVNTTSTITVTVKDKFGNKIPTATPAAFTPTLTGAGALGAFSCTLGVCTATYTAPAAVAPASISVKIGAVEIKNSPLTLTITP